MFADTETVTQETETAVERTPKPRYWDWWVWLIDEWEAPKGLDKAYVVAVLGAMNVKATDGRALYPHNQTVMRQLQKSKRWVQQYRAACLREGLVREVHPKRWMNGVLVLEICHPDCLQCTTVHPRGAPRCTHDQQ